MGVYTIYAGKTGAKWLQEQNVKSYRDYQPGKRLERTLSKELCASALRPGCIGAFTLRRRGSAERGLTRAIGHRIVGFILEYSFPKCNNRPVANGWIAPRPKPNTRKTPPALYFHSPSTLRNAREEEELFLRLAPRCPQHQRPGKLLTVRKTGLNKGRKFYACSLPRGNRTLSRPCEGARARVCACACLNLSHVRLILDTAVISAQHVKY